MIIEKSMYYIFVFALVIFLLLCSVLYWQQDKLIFFPQMPVSDVYDQFTENEIHLHNEQHKLHGWKITINPDAEKTVIYFGGNASDSVYMNYEAEKFNVRELISFNFPGYGKSDGKASQDSLYSSAIDVYDHLIEKYSLSKQSIIIVGRSLGSSVATYLAAHRDAAGLILITPFDSIENIAAAQYKIFPVKFLLKHQFPTVEYIRKVAEPTLMLAAQADEIISDNHLQDLVSEAGENNKLIRYKEVGHNTIQLHPDYYADINGFIETL